MPTQGLSPTDASALEPPRRRTTGGFPPSRACDGQAPAGDPETSDEAQTQGGSIVYNRRGGTKHFKQGS